MKKIISVGLLLTMLFSLVGCNDQPLTSVYGKAKYTVSLETLKSSYGTVVAQLGDQKITAEVLQIAYWTEFVNFLYQHSNNLTPYNLDPSLPLQDQIIPGSDNHTWQQHFLDEALKTLHNYLAAIQSAQVEGITMPADIMTAVDAEAAEMEQAAKDEGYTDMDAYVTYLYGPGCTFNALKAYNYLSMCTNYYQNVHISQIEITDQMVDDYYEAHKQDFVNAGMLQDDRIVYQVRHLTVMVDEGSDESVWEAARVKAQGYLDMYLAGEQTEEAFAEMAATYSDDGETYMDGGFVSGLVPESTYPTAYKEWYLDASHQKGDVGLVKTELGYFVMYYLGPTPTWRYETTQSMVNSMVSAIVPDAVAKYPITVHFDKLMVSEAALEQ